MLRFTVNRTLVKGLTDSGFNKFTMTLTVIDLFCELYFMTLFLSWHGGFIVD
jgi:hypothetical protein